MGFDIKKENMMVIALANPLIFGFTFVGIAFIKDEDNFLLFVFKKDNVVFKKMYKTFAWAKRAFKRLLANKPGEEPEWLDIAYCFNLTGEIRKDKRGGVDA